MSTAKKYLYLVLGSICFAAGFLGVFLPVLPTTPFMLLSCYFYSKSSQRFHAWLTSTETYQKYGKDFMENQQMPRKQKIYILTIASLMLLFPFFLLQGWFRLLIVAVYLFLYYYFFAKIKTVG